VRAGILGASVAWLVAIALVTAAAPVRAEDDPELEQLRRAIRESRERVIRYEREQRGLLETVEALDRSAAAIERDLAQVRRVAEQARETLKRVDSEAATIRERRKLLERAMYAPSNARFKVYMIDEVHMLTSHAFNAMLKTLEEPPDYVKFILATTDPQKIPVTVLSRCLQFNLKQMMPAAIAGNSVQRG